LINPNVRKSIPDHFLSQESVGGLNSLDVSMLTSPPTDAFDMPMVPRIPPKHFAPSVTKESPNTFSFYSKEGIAYPEPVKILVSCIFYMDFYRNLYCT
jgi:hypothetical protein